MLPIRVRKSARSWTMTLLACLAADVAMPVAMPVAIHVAVHATGYGQVAAATPLAADSAADPRNDRIPSQIPSQIAAERSEIALLRGQFADGSLPDPQRLAALAEAERRLGILIDTHPEHWQRPMWQCDLAEMWLFDELIAVHQHALLAADFGIPTPAQREALDRLGPAAHTMMRQARTAFLRLERTLPREDDHGPRRLDTGLWQAWVQYRQVNLPLLLARAAYAAALSQTLSDTFHRAAAPRDTAQDASRDTSRDASWNTWLRQDVLGEAGALANDEQAPPAVRSQAALLAARAALRLGDRELAARHLADVEAELAGRATVDTITRLTLALSRATLAAADQLADARARLATAQEETAADGDPTLQLMVRDARYRLAAANAPRGAQQSGEAALPWEVYRDLFEPVAQGRDPHADPANPADEMQRQVLARRWLRQWTSLTVGASDTAHPRMTRENRLPAFVVLAMADAALQAGRAWDDNLTQEPAAASDSTDQAVPDPLVTDSLFTDARAAFACCQTLTAALLARDDLEPGAARQAMRLQGWAIYEAAPRSAHAQLQAARLWTELAARHPGSAMALSALADAVTLLRELHRGSHAGTDHIAIDRVAIERATIERAYVAAAQRLIDQFPTSSAADDERLYFAYAALVPAGRYDDAAVVLGDVPSTHRDYLAARRELMYARLAKYQQMPWFRRPDMADPVERAAAALEQAADMRAARRHGSAGDTERDLVKGLADELADARVHVRLVRAELAIDRQAVDPALAQLDEAERIAGHNTSLRQHVWERRIDALMQAGRLTQAARAARDMLDQYPAQAVEVIYRLIERVGGPMNDDASDPTSTAEERTAGTHADEERQRQLLTLAGELAQLVLEGDASSSRRLSADQRQQFELMAARAAAMTGDLTAAEAMLRPLVAHRPNDARMLHHLAEVLFEQCQAGERQAEEERAAQAAELYRRLLDGLDAQSAMWWNAWRRTLQLQAARVPDGGRDVDIFLSIRQLEAVDPRLGGEPYRTALRRLAREHEPVDNGQ